MREVAGEVLRIAEAGLKRRARQDRKGEDERKHLASLHEAVEGGKSPAEILLAAFERDWGGDIDRLFDTRAF